MPKKAMLACVLALLGTGLSVFSASAVGQTPLELAQLTARTYWGADPCGGQVQVQWQDQTPTPAIAGTEVEAWVTFDTPSGSINFFAAPDSYTNCVVNISANAWPTYAATVEGYPQFCQMMIHEIGHFEGYADSTTQYPPSDIRYSILSSSNMPDACKYDISAGTGLSKNGFPMLPSALQARVTPETRLIRSRCFERRCHVYSRLKKSPHRRHKRS